MRYAVKYVHRISPDEDADIGPDIWLSPSFFREAPRDVATSALARELRDRKILESGRSLRDFRVESSGVFVLFPRGGLWHSIILTPKEEEASTTK